MKIVLTGGGSGGHFYPLIAVAEQLRAQAAERKLLDPELIYLGPEPFDREALIAQDIAFAKTPAGKMRRYASIFNVFDAFKTLFGIIKSVFQLYSLYPDVIFSKGGYAAFPTMVAARVLRIPVVIHESDAHPGRSNLYAAKFARAIGIAHPDAAHEFPERVRDRIALVGNPIRHGIEHPSPAGGHEFLDLRNDVPTLLVLGGSQGAQAINDTIIDALPILVERYNVVHQTGSAHLEEVKGLAHVRLREGRYEERYRAYGLLNELALRMAAGIASLIIARAGSGTIFEVASWGIPSILVPIPEDVSHDQTKNAFSYARSGAAEVMEQKNLTPHLLIAEVDRIMGDPALRQQMSEAAKAFARPDAAAKIAHVILETALEHAQ
ncbi:MAG TPA: UDP-N-acetylglucosamine--N-acetylmuramyl-(pentapeptide) pyrophosphoryl-undecaprenol N-acetylglucosamine transferase [Candidatus Paceibacterota bacterium]|nr:UDP-N-acetylglucosamine--N-acetylmuramyl-(pentapeptide) pyrophosphoryl-undecaprenol N-acetylglucosamine transferase [Candidatus Paceibacterota bacterium]